jgi:hypothetical protein
MKPLSLSFESVSRISASNSGAMVRYGRNQSPQPPRRMNSSRWMSIHFVAYARQARRSSSRVGLCFFSANSRPTCISMGMPWLSQPGTYGASYPWSEAWRTAASFQILFAAVPMWMWLLE